MAKDSAPAGPGLLSAPEDLPARGPLLELSAAIEALLRGAPWLRAASETSVAGRLGAERLRLRTAAFRGGPLRWVRHVELLGDQGTLALNTCFFPEHSSPLPLWSCEILALRDRLHLVALDALPCGPVHEDACRALLLRSRRLLMAPEQLPAMPPWAQAISSPWALFLRRPSPLPSAEHLTLGVQQAAEAFLELATAPPGNAAADPTPQRMFLAAMSENDPAVAYLGRAFGAAWARQYCEEILFPPC